MPETLLQMTVLLSIWLESFVPKNAKPGKIILGILILLTVEESICRVDIPGYEELISQVWRVDILGYAELISPGIKSWYPQVWRVDIPRYEELISPGMKSWYPRYEELTFWGMQTAELICLGMKSWYPRVWRVDIPGYEGLISTGMKGWYPLVWRGPEMKEQWGSTRRHCAVGRSRQRSCLWSCSLLLSPFQHHPRRQLYNSNRSLGSFELTWLPPCGPSTVLLRSHSSKG